jgi:hypothetical protein
MKKSQVKNIIRESLKKAKTLPLCEHSNEISDDILNWLYNKFYKDSIDNLKVNITPEELTGLQHAYKKAKEGDTGFASNYVKNLLKINFSKK